MRTHKSFAAVLTLAAALGVAVAAQDLTVPNKSSGTLRFAVIGDSGTGDSNQYRLAKVFTDLYQRFPYEFVLMMGDNMYGGESARDFQKKFEAPYKPVLDKGVKFYAAIGNHDSPTQKSYKPFNMNGQGYYTYKKGNAQFFVLDSSYMSPLQLSWLAKELQNSRADWKICYFHHALYSSGAFHGSAVELRRVLEPLFIEYGVDVVFAGHEHVYERVKPQHGIYYFTEGASGELRQGNLRKTNLTASGFDLDRTFMLVEISGNELSFQTISRPGKTIDSGFIERNVSESGARGLVKPASSP